jgi:DNA polymerase-3 subunit delta'
MPLAPFAGHLELRRRLSNAISNDKLPQVLLVTGPAGAGKQRLGLWLAQRLVCSQPKGDEPCGVCSACIKVLNLAHPDVHWMVPVPRPKAGEPDKQIEEVAETLAAVMAERRADPLWGVPDGMSNHGIASARWLQRRIALMASEGGWRIFIIGNAERLVPQESSPEAANALLKLLEEPPPRSLFVLTTAEPGLVLPTIRSRTVPVRVGRLTDDEVREFLMTAAPDKANDDVVSNARGLIGAAVGSGKGGAAAKALQAAKDVLVAVRGGDAAMLTRALKQGAFAGRGEFTEMLDALATLLARHARRAVTEGREAIGFLDAVHRVQVTRERAQGNVNPQLLLAALVDDLAVLGAA